MAYRLEMFNTYPNFQERRCQGVSKYRAIALIPYISEVMVKDATKSSTLYGTRNSENSSLTQKRKGYLRAFAGDWSAPQNFL